MPQNFFLVGSVRSGTTLLRLLLGHHPRICRCEEMEFVAEYLAGHGDDPDLRDYHRFLEQDRGFRASGYEIQRHLPFREQALDFLDQRARIDGKPLAGAAVHHAFSALAELWPQARYIYLVRDPRDVARSCVQMGWAGSAWHGTRFWSDAQDEWEALRRRLPEAQRLELKFEDLVADAEATLRQVCDFLEVDYDPQMLEIERDTTYKRPDPGEARSWRDTAPVDDVRQIETRLGPQRLSRAGYQPSGHAPLTGGVLTRLRIDAQDVWRRVAFRIGKYGWGLWLSGVISRRLPFRGLKTRIKLRLDEVDNRLLK